MRAILRLSFIATSTALMGTAVAAVNVLGLPLGGQLAGPIPECTMKEITARQSKNFCWIDPPSRYRGGYFGNLLWPGRESRVQWAEFSSLSKVSLDKKLKLKGFTVNASYNKADMIADSITKRFGAASYVASEMYLRRWEAPDIHIQLLCAREFGCYVEFHENNPELEDAARKEVLKRKEIDSKRPNTP